MASIFSKIINGELPARFVWKDERCVAFMSIAPLRAGHTLVVPREEVDHWVDLTPELAAHLTVVAQSIGRAIYRAFAPTKVGLMIAGLEVPHTHVHVSPIDGVHDLDFSNADPNADPASIESAAERIRRALRELGFEQVVR